MAKPSSLSTRPLISVLVDTANRTCSPRHHDSPDDSDILSVRISSKKKYTGGLFIADIYSMPHGCSVWPAYWSIGAGKDWPLAGEIDIIGAHPSLLPFPLPRFRQCH